MDVTEPFIIFGWADCCDSLSAFAMLKSADNKTAAIRRDAEVEYDDFIC